MKPETKTDQQRNTALVGVWLPKAMKEMLDHAVSVFDSDRSKYLRHALREKLDRDLASKLTN
jgi:metal-responsive CopG/Arc/MetJ family transcriptional regulator